MPGRPGLEEKDGKLVMDIISRKITGSMLEIANRTIISGERIRLCKPSWRNRGANETTKVLNAVISFGPPQLPRLKLKLKVSEKGFALATH